MSNSENTPLTSKEVNDSEFDSSEKDTKKTPENESKVKEDEEITSGLKQSETESKKDYGQIFQMSQICQFFINKKMPEGFKLELEENLNKEPQSRGRPYLCKKHKRSNVTAHNNNQNNENNDNANNDKENPNKVVFKPKKTRKRGTNLEVNLIQNYESKLRREHKPKIIEDLGYIDKDVIKGKSNPLRRAVSKLCERGMLKIKRISFSGFFYNVGKSDQLSLTKIEKNIRDYKYQSTYEFIMDLRKFWNTCLETYNYQPIIANRVSQMCKTTEELYKELESYNIEKTELEEMSKKVSILERKLREIKGNQAGLGSGFNLKKQNSEKMLSMAEKTALKNKFRFLTMEQKKGLVTILKDIIDTSKKCLEFDIGKLSNKKVRELDKYVNDCIKINEEKQRDDKVKKLKDELEKKEENEGSNGSGKNEPKNLSLNGETSEPKEESEEESSLESDSSSLSEE